MEGDVSALHGQVVNPFTFISSFLSCNRFPMESANIILISGLEISNQQLTCVVMLSLYQAVEAHGVARGWSSHIFYTIGSQMVVRLSALHAGHPLHPKKIPGTHFCYTLSQFWGHNAAGKIRSTENPVASSALEPVTFQLV
jgi:hypothetical protein